MITAVARIALLSIAEMLQKCERYDGLGLDRSVLILHVSAEEKGLLGSRYYSDHPVDTHRKNRNGV